MRTYGLVRDEYFLFKSIFDRSMISSSLKMYPQYRFIVALILMHPFLILVCSNDCWEISSLIERCGEAAGSP